MDHVDLPILPADATLSQAGEAMYLHHRSGVVTSRQGNLVVLTEEDMHNAVVARNDPKGGSILTLADVSPRRHLTRRPGRTHPGLGFAGAPHVASLAASVCDDSALRDAFDVEPEAAVTILEHTDDVARVATAHEGIAAALSSAITRGICRDPARDRWWPYELLVKGRCNFDGSVVDFT